MPTDPGYTAVAAGYRHSLALDSRGAPGVTGLPPVAEKGVAFSYEFTVTGSPAPTVTTVDAELPPGLTLSESGVLSGTPTKAGTYTFTVTASNGVDPDATLPVTLTVKPADDTSGSLGGSLGDSREPDFRPAPAAPADSFPLTFATVAPTRSWVGATVVVTSGAASGRPRE